MGLHAKKDQKYLFIDGCNLLANAAHVATKWTKAVASDVLSYDKSANDDTTTFEGNLLHGVHCDALVGSRIDKLVLHYTVGAAALDAVPTFELHKVTFNATTNVPTGAAVALTGTTSKAVGSHAIAFTPTSTLTYAQGNVINFELVFNAAETSTIKVYGLELYFTPAGE